MKVNGFKASTTGKECRGLPMAMCTLEHGAMGKDLARAPSYSTMKTGTRASGRRISSMEKVSTCGQMGTSTKETMQMERSMALASLFRRMGTGITASSKRV